MKIGFIVHRNSYYKHFGSIIDEALRRGHKVVCFHDYSHQRTGKKAYQFPWVERVPLFRFGRPECLAFNGLQQLFKVVQEQNVEMLVSLDFMPCYVEVCRQLKNDDVYWVVVQGGGDMLLNSLLSLSAPDKILLCSDVWIGLYLSFLSLSGLLKGKELFDFGEKLKRKSTVVGFAQVDQKEIIEPDRVRSQWGIPPEKPVVLFLPFPFGSSSDRFWAPFVYGMDNWLVQLPLALLSFKGRYVKQVLRRWNDKQLVRALKKFCQNNNAFLLVKAREKDPVRGYLAKAADKVLYDEEVYPATALKCLSIAALCCNFYSSAVLEAAALGTANLCIAPDIADWADIQQPLWEMFLEKANDLHNFPGVSYKLTIPQAIEAFSKKSLKDFPLERERQKQYIQKYIGAAEGGYAKKAVDELENLVNPHKIS